MALRPSLELAIALPFQIDAYGTILATVDQSKIWADRVRSVIGTAIGERIYRPEFGCAAAFKIFETEETTVNLVEEDIRRAFISFLPLCRLDETIVSVDEINRIINVEVVYTTPTAEQYALEVAIATINGTNPISEEITWRPL